MHRAFYVSFGTRAPDQRCIENLDGESRPLEKKQGSVTLSCQLRSLALL